MPPVGWGMISIEKFYPSRRQEHGSDGCWQDEQFFPELCCQPPAGFSTCFCVLQVRIFMSIMSVRCRSCIAASSAGSRLTTSQSAFTSDNVYLGFPPVVLAKVVKELLSSISTTRGIQRKGSNYAWVNTLVVMKGICMRMLVFARTVAWVLPPSRVMSVTSKLSEERSLKASPLIHW